MKSENFKPFPTNGLESVSNLLDFRAPFQAMSVFEKVNSSLAVKWTVLALVGLFFSYSSVAWAGKDLSRYKTAANGLDTKSLRQQVAAFDKLALDHIKKCQADREQEALDKLERVLRIRNILVSVMQERGYSLSLVCPNNGEPVNGSPCDPDRRLQIFQKAVEQGCLEAADAVLKDVDSDAGIYKAEAVEFREAPEVEVETETGTGTDADEKKAEWIYEGNIKAGLVVQFGSIDSTAFDFLTELNSSWKKWSFDGKLEAFYTETTDNTQEVKNTERNHRIQLALSQKYDLSKKVYIIGKQSAYTDRTVEWEATPTVGFGWRVIEDEKTKLNLEAAPGATWIKRDGEDLENHFVVRYGGKLTQKISENLAAGLTTEINSDDSGRHLINAEATFALSLDQIFFISQKVALELAYRWRHDTDAQEFKNENGLILRITIPIPWW